MLINKLILFFNCIDLSEEPEIITQPKIYSPDNIELIYFSINFKTDENFKMFINTTYSRYFNIYKILSLYKYETKTENNKTFYINEGKFDFLKENRKISFYYFDSNIFNICFPICKKYDLRRSYNYFKREEFKNNAWQFKILLPNGKGGFIELETIVFKYNESTKTTEKIEKYGSKTNKLMKIKDNDSETNYNEYNSLVKKSENKTSIFDLFIVFSLILLTIIYFCLFIYYLTYKN